MALRRDGALRVSISFVAALISNLLGDIVYIQSRRTYVSVNKKYEQKPDQKLDIPGQTANVAAIVSGW